jgi:carboxypeptidase family protein/TonB-dependent receptor-like protein
MQHSIPRWYRVVALMCTVVFVLDSRAVVAQSSSTEAHPARLTGRVHDAVGSAIVKAEIVVTNTSLRAESGTDGRFELAGLPSGPVEVVVRRLGFSPAKIPLEMGAGEMRDIRVLLSPVAMMMDSVAVTADAPAIEKAFGGFEMRKSRGFGTFITREQIEKKNPRVTTDLFRSVSGVKLLRENGTPTLVSARLGTTAYCPVRYYIDGQSYPLYGQSIDTMVQPADIGAIEIYPGGATVPPQFGGRESACGVVAIWTRQGVRKQK